MRTYSRRTTRVEDAAQNSGPRIIHRMDSIGRLKTERIGLPPVPENAGNEAIENAIPPKEPERPTTPKNMPSDELLSSPLSPASNPFSSDEEAELFSLPSSPPKRHRSSTPAIKSRKPAFSFLNKKRKVSFEGEEEEVLSEVNANTVQTRKKLPPAKKPRLVQTTLDLGGEVNRTCKGCGMEYIPSNAEDAAMHKAFHGHSIGGVDLGKSFLKDASIARELGDGEYIVVTDGRSSSSARRRVRTVLDVVTQDLGAVEIEDEHLWGEQEKPKTKTSTKGNSPTESPSEGCKMFLYCVGNKCVGLCLAERIRSAAKVIPSASKPPSSLATGHIITKSSSILTEPSSAPMLLGISRIWTSKSFRHKGIATQLLDYVRSHYFYGIEVPKKMIAFSQPTESGLGLAERWFGIKNVKNRDSLESWHVYTDGV
jgi:N-acetyltransferase